MCQCRSILGKKYLIQWNDNDNGGDYACVDGAGAIYEIFFITSPQFSCKPKTALKKKSLKSKFVRNSNEVYGT